MLLLLLRLVLVGFVLFPVGSPIVVDIISRWRPLELPRARFVVERAVDSSRVTPRRVAVPRPRVGSRPGRQHRHRDDADQTGHVRRQLRLPMLHVAIMYFRERSTEAPLRLRSSLYLISPDDSSAAEADCALSLFTLSDQV